MTQKLTQSCLNHSVFAEEIIKNNLFQPTRYNFSLEKWNKAWDLIKVKSSARDQKIYKAGVMVDSLLCEIRGELKDLYKLAPKTNFERLILSYIATSNRTTAVAYKLAIEKLPSNIQSTMVKANSDTFMEVNGVFHGAVDGVQLAIRGCLLNIENKKKIEISKQPIDEMSFIQKESWLSQLYSTYEHLWQCILWSDYEVIEQDEKHKIFIVKQPFNSLEIAFLNSVNRKSRLDGQNMFMASRPLIKSKFLADKFIMVKRVNKKRLAYVESLRNVDDKLITLNTSWRLKELDLVSHYPKDWLTEDYGAGFNISDALNVMRCLMLMANSLAEKYPDDDSAFNINKLWEFCPTVQAFSLHRALCEASGIHAQKVIKIVNLITMKASSSSDLWCQPLIKTSKNEYAILVSALCAPSISRMVEHWFIEFGIDLAEKGYTYEQTVLDELNDLLKNNHFIADYNVGVSKRIKLKTGEEEFDLLTRIDDMIIIGEAKSIVTTDSEISKYRTAAILQHAGEQVNRKTKFLKDNLEVIFNHLQWPYDKNKKYTINKCILNSGKILVGYEFEGVPVIDELILSAYFRSNKMNLLSVPLSTGEFKTIASYLLYNNLQELKDNFSIYLATPPQLSETAESFEYNDIKFPCISDNSFKIVKRYLVLKQSGPLARIAREHKFPVLKSTDFEEQAAKIQIAM